MNHLTREQISEWMIGPRPQAQMDHVASCPECAQAIARTEAMLGDFTAAYREWGTAQTRFIAAPAPRPAALLWLRTALAGAALAAILIAIPTVQHFRAERQQAIEDDALLTQIQADVARSVPSSLKPLAELGSAE